MKNNKRKEEIKKIYFPPTSILGVVPPSFLLPILCIAAPFSKYGTASRAFASRLQLLGLCLLGSWPPWLSGPVAFLL